MTSLVTEASARVAPVGRSHRRLTVGLLITTVAIAFESIAVATAMPVAAHDLQALSYYSWSFSLFLVGMLFSTVLAGRHRAGGDLAVPAERAGPERIVDTATSVRPRGRIKKPRTPRPALRSRRASWAGVAGAWCAGAIKARWQGIRHAEGRAARRGAGA
jgi:MFS family permease